MLVGDREHVAHRRRAQRRLDRIDALALEPLEAETVRGREQLERDLGRKIDHVRIEVPAGPKKKKCKENVKKM